MGKGKLEPCNQTNTRVGNSEKGIIIEECFSIIPTEWLKVLAKYYAITDRYSAREINEILSKR